MNVKKITPIVNVDSIEEALPFWRDALGFEVVATVPHGDALGFAILVQGERGVMLQTRASLADDLPAVVAAACSQPSVLLYVDVESIDEAEKALQGVEVLVPRRRTFYGADEVWVREPSGAILGFAQHDEH